MINHTFKPYADAPDLCVAELESGETCNAERAKHQTFYSACGAENSKCCYPLFDEDNNEIADEPDRDSLIGNPDAWAQCNKCGNEVDFFAYVNWAGELVHVQESDEGICHWCSNEFCNDYTVTTDPKPED